MGNRWNIVDKKSTNGIVVNGTRIPPNVLHPLEVGDVIIIGRCGKTFADTEFQYIFSQKLVPIPPDVQTPSPQKHQLLARNSQISLTPKLNTSGIEISGESQQNSQNSQNISIDPVALEQILERFEEKNKAKDAELAMYREKERLEKLKEIEQREKDFEKRQAEMEQKEHDLQIEKERIAKEMALEKEKVQKMAEKEKELEILQKQKEEEMRLKQEDLSKKTMKMMAEKEEAFKQKEEELQKQRIEAEKQQKEKEEQMRLKQAAMAQEVALKEA